MSKNVLQEIEKYYRIWQIIGCKKRGIEPIIPISRSSFLRKVQMGDYPKPIKLGFRTSAWKRSDIEKLLASFGDHQ